MASNVMGHEGKERLCWDILANIPQEWDWLNREWIFIFISLESE